MRGPASEGMAVSVRGVQFTYPSGRTGVAGIDLAVAPGEVVTLLGPNGSGKSTLLRLLATDLRPERGALEIFGSDPRESVRRTRRRIGYAGDDPTHIPPLSGEENARYFAELCGRAGPSTVRRVRDLFSRFALEDVRGIAVSDYSFGMRRKLLLIEAMGPSPDLTLLDEPSVGLDPDGVRVLRDCIRELAQAGSAVVIASNEIREIPLWGTRVVFLHRGSVVEDAPVPQLLARLGDETHIDIHIAPGSGSTSGRGSEPDDLLELLGGIPDIAGARATNSGFHIRSSAGGRPLPTLLETCLRAGVGVRDVRVREPDLGDLFRARTGEALESTPAPSGRGDSGTA